MKNQNYSFSVLDEKALEEKFQTDRKKGLCQEEAAKRLKTYGQNELSNNRVHWWVIFLRQLKSPFIYLLAVAALLAFILGEGIDALMILIFIAINTILGFVQEFKSEQALKTLQKYTVAMTKVIRGGKKHLIKATEIVPGDLLVLQTGDMVSADARIIGGDEVMINESILSGESASVYKNGNEIEQEPCDIYGATNLVFSGTNVVSGNVLAIVVATGGNTTFGQIKKITGEISKESIFAKGIASFSSFILKMTVITLVFVFVANIAIKGDEANISELFIFAIALAVSVIPEALPVVTTLSLSKGALKLAKHDVITKRLTAVEDLGSIEVLCTDKTGTITENKLKVVDFWRHDDSEDLLYFGNLAGNMEGDSNEPFDIALREAFLKNKKKLPKFKHIAELPFNPARRRNSVLVEDKEGERILIVRGAPEEIIDLSANIQGNKKRELKKWLKFEGEKGHRTLAIAIRRLGKESRENITALEKRLSLVGVVSFSDTIKKSTFQSVNRAKELGVDVVMITGDNLEVAYNVGLEVGLVSSSEQAMIAHDFMELSTVEQKKRIKEVKVFARTDPEQKHYLIKLLQEEKEVGFLGEGINDSPALKAAGVSIVVQSASDISRETADIILLKKDLSVIIEGIAEGRKIFSNTVKYLKATLASNFGNFYAVAISSLFIDYLPMLPVQILLVNLLSDFPSISISADSVDPDETVSPRKYNIKDVVLVAVILGVVSTIFDFMFFGFFYRISPEVLQTNWFIGSILTELAFLFSIRTKQPFFKAVAPAKGLVFFSLAAGLATILIPYTQIGRELFRFVAPTSEHLVLILSLVAAYFVCSEIVKLIFYRTVQGKH